MLGSNSMLGAKDPRPFATQVQSLQRRLSLLFEALHAPDVQRHDPTQRWTGSDGEALQRVACRDSVQVVGMLRSRPA